MITLLISINVLRKESIKVFFKENLLRTHSRLHPKIPTAENQNNLRKHRDIEPGKKDRKATKRVGFFGWGKAVDTGKTHRTYFTIKANM